MALILLVAAGLSCPIRAERLGGKIERIGIVEDESWQMNLSRLLRFWKDNSEKR